VVYPTETCYGLGADALDADAVERVFAAKGRDPDDPLSLAVPGVDDALEHTRPTPLARRFMHEFLPGPVTVVVEHGGSVPDALVAGLDRVGVRVPDHDVALALLDRAGPLTGTSANPSGDPAATHHDGLDPGIREAAAVVLEAGGTGGGASTVVDPERGEIHRRGRRADDVEAWLQQRA
jgi:L-threonylcarbamoyladenylate synthase